MKLIATQKSEQNEAAFDPWTFVHLAAGLALGLMDTRLRLAIGLSLTYELAEQVFERRQWGKEFFHTHRPESVPNAVVDLAALVAGHRLGELWNRTPNAGKEHGHARDGGASG